MLQTMDSSYPLKIMVAAIVVVAMVFGDAHAASLKNYTTYNSTGHASGNITIDVDDFQTEVKNTMGATAMAIISVMFAYLFNSIRVDETRVDYRQGFKILFLGAALSGGILTTHLIVQNNSKALPALVLSTWVYVAALSLVLIMIVWQMFESFKQARRLGSPRYQSQRQPPNKLL